MQSRRTNFAVVIFLVLLLSAIFSVYAIVMQNNRDNPMVIFAATGLFAFWFAGLLFFFLYSWLNLKYSGLLLAIVFTVLALVFMYEKFLGIR